MNRKKILAVNGVIIFVCLFVLLTANTGLLDKWFGEDNVIAVQYHSQPVIYEQVNVPVEKVVVKEVPVTKTVTKVIEKVTVKEVPVHTTSTEFERWSRQQALDRANQLIKDVGERK